MKRILTSITTLLTACCTMAQTGASDSTGVIVHRIEIEESPGGILHTNRFLRGENVEARTMNHANTVALKYAFQPAPGSRQALTYKGSYQGIGVALHNFNPQLGNPVSAFLFQGATIATLAQRLALNYEWNLGLAMGWRPHDNVDNPDNRVIGSRVTANITAALYLKYTLSCQLDLNAGLTLTHFSNGNTALPNAGLNTLGAKVSLAYYVNRHDQQPQAAPPPFEPERRWHTDLVLFGAWKCKGISTEDGGAFAIPGKFLVAGLNVSPMRQFNPWLRLGPSLDVVYDHSANIMLNERVLHYSYWMGTDDDIRQPSWYRQVAVGLSAHTEFTMPWFSINLGFGHHLINCDTDFRGFYETLALKIAATRRLFLHIGYSLYDYRYPNNLMLGLGCRI